MDDRITNQPGFPVPPAPSVRLPEPDEDVPPRHNPLSIWSQRNLLLLGVNVIGLALIGLWGVPFFASILWRIESPLMLLTGLLTGAGLGAIIFFYQLGRQIGRGIRSSKRELPRGQPIAPASASLSRSIAQGIVTSPVSIPHTPTPFGPPRHVPRFTGHAGPVTAVAVSADGRLAVSADDWNRVALLWDIETGFEYQAFHGFGWVIHSLAFSPDGRLIAGAGRDEHSTRTNSRGAVRIWDAQTGQELRRFEIAGDIHAVAFHPDGRHILLGGHHYLRVWEIDGPKLVAMIDLQRGLKTDPILAIALSTDGRSALAGCYLSQDARLVNLDTYQEVRTFTGHTAGPLSLWTAAVAAVAFSPDGLRVLTGSWDTTVRVWNLAGKELLCVQDTRGWWGWRGVAGVAWLDDRRFVSVNHHGHLCLWDASTGVLLATHTHPASVTSLAVTPDGRVALTAGRDGVVRLWDV